MKMMYAIVAAMLATTALSVQGMRYDTTNSCTGEDNTNADGDFVQCIVVQGPASLDIKPLVGVGIGFCTGPDLGPADAFPCFQAGATNVGAAIFSNTGFGAGGNRLVSVWAQWITGTFVSGFSMLVCNDRDLDNTCTNIGVHNDQLRDAFSNQAQIASAPCDDDKKNKDDKRCDVDPTDAEVAEFCMMPAFTPPGWHNGQVVAFIGNWESADPFDPNIGHGVSEGNYEVWMKVHRMMSDHDMDPSTPDVEIYTPCTPPACDDRVDNDGDGTVDFDDLQCNGYDDPSEEPACSDGFDNNDEDSLADYPADPDCTSATDNNEKSFLEWAT